MRDNFPACLAETLRHEGGWADHPKDPGGATMKGVTLATYRRWKPGATKDDLRRITDAEVAAIYRKGYWDAVNGDDLPAGLDLVAFDGAVNSGPARGAKWLQQALGVTADGKIGPKTIAAARAAQAEAVIDRACDLRMAFLRGLNTWPTFGKGWGRRVNEVRDAATAMAAKPATKPAQKPAAPAAAPSPVGIGAVVAVIVALAIIAVIFGG